MSDKWKEGMFIDVNKLKSKYVVTDGETSLDIDSDSIKLYAAAPELYEALEAAANSSGFQYMFSDTRDKINAALSKARGEHK